jgi:hypothetical protein
MPAQGMVACCDEVCTACKKVVCRLRQNAVSGRTVFTVHDAKINALQLFEGRQQTAQAVAAGRSDYIADKKNNHKQTFQYKKAAEIAALFVCAYFA